MFIIVLITIIIIIMFIFIIIATAITIIITIIIITAIGISNTHNSYKNGAVSMRQTAEEKASNPRNMKEATRAQNTTPRDARDNIDSSSTNAIITYLPPICTNVMNIDTLP